MVMAEAAWDQTAAVVCKIHNVNCTKESEMIFPWMVNPFYIRKGTSSNQSARGVIDGLTSQYCSEGKTRGE